MATSTERSEPNLQRDFTDLSFYEKKASESGQLGHQDSCEACNTLTCHSIRRSVGQNCPVKDCYFCAGVATIDDEISDTYQRLVDLVQKREQAINKPHYETFIHRLPVEILSLIFVFVKKTYDDARNPLYNEPRTSPALLVGAICKKWRNITLQTPQLWTDIIIDLRKPADTQVNLVNEWACRSGALPINLEVFLPQEDYYHECENSTPAGRQDVALALRSLAIRWNDVILFVPWYFCLNLFDDLEESPSISWFHICLSDDPDTVLDPIKLRHPFRPKRFYSRDVSGLKIPLEWDNLVHLEIENIDDAQQALHIMRHAHNLRHWDVESKSFKSGADLPKPTTYIANRSLIFFKTNIKLVGHLILPSLQHLHYSIGCSTLSSTEQLDSLSDFINRSCPPLQTFLLNYCIDAEDPNFSLKKLPGITSLYVTDYSRINNPVRIDHLFDALTRSSTEVILPRLVEISLEVHRMTPLSWSAFSRLFQTDSPGSKDMKAFATFGRPLSKVHIWLSNDSRMEKDTFLHLLAVRKSGADLNLWSLVSGDLFLKMSKIHAVQLEEAASDESD